MTITCPQLGYLASCAGTQYAGATFIVVNEHSSQKAICCGEQGTERRAHLAIDGCKDSGVQVGQLLLHLLRFRSCLPADEASCRVPDAAPSPIGGRSGRLIQRLRDLASQLLFQVGEPLPDLRHMPANSHGEASAGRFCAIESRQQVPYAIVADIRVCCRH